MNNINPVPQLFSIPVELHSVEAEVDAKWIIPPEAEVELQSHHSDCRFTIEKVFRIRLTSHSIRRAWDWLLVVLPDRYPIGGYLASIRGPKENVVMMDGHILAEVSCNDRTRGVWLRANYMPRGARDQDVHVSCFFIQTKGLLDEYARREGGWMGQLARNLSQVPSHGNWIYMADAPPSEWVNKTRPHNKSMYRKWAITHEGPARFVESDDPGLLKERFLLNCATEAKDMGHAVMYYRKYLALRPEDARITLAAAIIYYRIGQRLDRALALARRASRLAKEWLLPQIVMARIYFKGVAFERFDAGVMKRAEESLRGVLERDTLDLDVRRMLVECLQLQESGSEEHYAQVKELVQLDPADTQLINMLGYLSYFKGHRAEAETLLEKASTLDPGCSLALNGYGYLLAERGELGKAMSLCERAVELDKNSNTLDSLGYVYLKLGELNKAEALFQEALAMNPGNDDAQGHMAEVQMQIKGD